MSKREAGKDELIETVQKLKDGYADLVKKVKPSPAAVGCASVHFVWAAYGGYKAVGMDKGQQAMVKAVKDILQWMENDLKQQESASSHAE